MVNDNTETVTNTQHLAAAANGIKLITPSFRAISSCITVQWGGVSAVTRAQFASPESRFQADVFRQHRCAVGPPVWGLLGSHVGAMLQAA